MYLNANIRAGISTFAVLASPDKIAPGCRKLAADIDTGLIIQVNKLKFSYLLPPAFSQH